MDIIDIGKVPISDESPAGRDIRGEQIFEDLSAEIEKLSSPKASGIINWNKVIEISVNILKTQSKDLLVCSYLSLALTKTQGMKGFATGVHIYLDCLNYFWDGLFPSKSRMRGRKNAIEWWIEKSSNALEGIGTIEEWKKEDIESLFNQLDAIEKFLSDNIEDPPSLRPMMTIAASRLREASIKESVETRPEREEPQAQTVRPSSPVTSKITTKMAVKESDPDKILRQGLNLLNEASTRLMEINLLDPLYFRLNRVVAWATVTDLPPSDEKGKTMLPPPDEQVVSALRSLYISQNWKDLLESAESRITEYLFWLDLSRYVVLSLERLNYKKISDEVAGETTLFVKRLKGIERLSFSNGMPFADNDTKSWLLSLDTKKESQPVTVYGDSELTKDIQAQLTNAEGLVKEEKINEAIKSLYEHVKSAKSGRDRFIWQIHFCRFLTEKKQTQLAVSHGKKLAEWIEKYGIEDWEPALAAEGFATILFCFYNQNLVEKDEIFYNNILRKLELIDPSRAIDYQTGGL